MRRVFCGAIALAAPMLSFGADRRGFLVRSGSLVAEFSSEGRLAAVRAGKIRRNIEAATLLEGCMVDGAPAARKLKSGALEVESSWSDRSRGRRCRLLERFSPGRDSIRWEVEIRGEGAPWTTPIHITLRYPASPEVKFWTAWSDPKQEDIGPPRRAVGRWNDPLVAMPLAKRKLWYGGPYFRYEDPQIGYSPLYGDLFSVPLATLMEPTRDFGLSLVLSPEDNLLDLTLTTGEDGSVDFARHFHRIGQAGAVRFSVDIAAHEADWRGGLRWMTRRYPKYFEPALAAAREMAGTGAYSAADTDFDVEKMKKMAFRVNWKASFDFPYMGMFLPPIDDGSWPRFPGDSGGSIKPGDPGRGTTSIREMAEYSRKMRSLGFYVLNYFNVTEFGANVTFPAPPRRAASDPGLWKNADDFLYGRLADAILFVPESVPAEAMKLYGRSKPGGPYYTWGNGIILDCAEPSYERFLLEQARRHIDKLPESSGICIDRMDWLRMYNEKRDDGLSWFPDKAARSLLVSWKGLMAKLGPMMHGAGKVIFVNNHDKRLDLLENIDGIFDEFTANGAALNTTAFLCVSRPALGWTNDEKQIRPDPDGFFQRFLYLGVYPMAPFPGNDHSLGPSEWVDRQYLDYGPLMDAMRGRKWVLEPHAVEVAGGAAVANLFAVRPAYAVPVMFGGSRTSATVTVRGLTGVIQVSADALHPGKLEPAPVKWSRQGESLVFEVPLVRGCAMLRFTPWIKVNAGS